MSLSYKGIVYVRTQFARATKHEANGFYEVYLNGSENPIFMQPQDFEQEFTAVRTKDVLDDLELELDDAKARLNEIFQKANLMRRTLQNE
jgi:hypothetical protein